MSTLQPNNMPIEKLMARENYRDWKFAMKAYLQLNDLWTVIDEELKEGDETKDRKALKKIILSIDKVNYTLIKDAKTAKEAWTLLEQAFDDSGLTRKVGLLKKLVTTRLENFKSVDIYCDTIISTAHKLNAMGFSVSDEWIGTLLLTGLPEDYKSMLMELESSGVNITGDSVKVKLLQDIKSPIEFNECEESAFYSRSENRNNNKKKLIRCFECNKKIDLSNRIMNMSDEECKKEALQLDIDLNIVKQEEEDDRYSIGSSYEVDDEKYITKGQEGTDVDPKNLLVETEMLKYESSSDSSNMDEDVMIGVPGMDLTKFEPELNSLSDNKYFKCTECNNAFQTDYGLLHHRVLTNGIHYRYTIWDKESNEQINFKLQVCVHIGEKPFECSECKEQFRSVSDLIKHMIRHTGEKPFKCSECFKGFSTNYHLKRHLLLHSGIKPYNCLVCDKRFTAKSTLKTHMFIHTGERPYKCTYCIKTCITKSELKRHMLLHTGEKPFKCSECEERFKNKNELVNHMGEHTGQKPFLCSICNKEFTTNTNVRRHMQLHSGIKPFKCTVCNKEFSEKSTLFAHMCIHTGERPFKCADCGKGCITKSQLNSHIKSHTGEKPFKCSECEKAFITKSDFMTHMRSHTRERPFKCSMCDKAFNQNAHLRRHFSRLHSNESNFNS